MITALSPAHLLILIVPLALTIVVIVAIVVTARDRTMTTIEQLAWILVLIVFPVVGLVAWLVVRLVSRGHRARPSAGV
ncbi:PLDc N-terminal domain-containing protein [uncultured Amnibacterium sp.]|uniref:PLDc N-terminal domain-containing protein n=1 Tax=uncultured Amnibacterium sp. TaxID=1631851 RepID=UPI0035CB1FF2